MSEQLSVADVLERAVDLIEPEGGRLQTIEYRGVLDKSAWERGPWDREADKKQWQDIETGLACLLVRSSRGNLCGYVGVRSGHPWHGKDYDHVGAYMPKPGEYDDDWYPDVHGGLTYAGACGHGDDPSRGICHVLAPGEPDDVWWLGFDCAHYGDYTAMADSDERRAMWGSDGLYRDQDYVERECSKLAKQAALAREQGK